jgi:hypothetical protein
MNEGVSLRPFALAVAVSLCAWSAFPQETEQDLRLAERVNALASPDAKIRAQARQELLASGREGIRALLDAAAGRNMIVAEQAREALTSAGPGAIRIIEEVGYYKAFDHRERLDEAVAAVARMGEPVLPRMLETLTTADPAGSSFGFAVGVLLRMEGPAVKPMIQLLKHPKAKVRYEAAVLLAQWRDPRAFDALVEGLADDDPAVRRYCALGLGDIGDHRAVEALLAALHNSVFGVRQAAAAALGKLYERRLLKPLARLARSDEDIQVRSTASNVLTYYSRDPVGIRLGKRYKPYALSPERQPWIQLGFAFRFALTGAVQLGSALWLSRRMVGKGGLHWPSVVWIAVVAGGSGFLWGRVVDNIWGSIEDQLLFVVVPLVAGVGFLGGKLFCADARRRLLVWRATGTTVVCFYVGYGLGWLALWGYFGF